MLNEKIEKCINNLMTDYGIVDYTISVDGQTNKGDGYSGHIIFISVTGINKNGVNETLHLTVKSSRQNEKFRIQTGIKEIYEKEIFIYEKVKPTFDQLQKENGIDDLVEVMPRCYKTFATDNIEMLILENLKIEGYGLWDKKLPMTFKHVHLVLETYGQWHALSMALKAQKPEIFEQLIENNVNIMTHLTTKTNMMGLMADDFEKTRSDVIGSDEKNILQYLQFSRDDVFYAFTDMFFEEPNYHVILHGDCWNSNMMFKCSDEITNPSAVRLIDWQCSGLASPVFDLSHFIYTCVDTGTYQDVTELLQIYYKSFSDCLKRLNCEASEIFAFDKLLDHWKRFSKYGLFIGNCVIRVCFGNSDQIPDLAEKADEGVDFSGSFKFEVTDEMYLKRVRNNMLHYVNNVKS